MIGPIFFYPNMCQYTYYKNKKRTTLQLKSKICISVYFIFSDEIIIYFGNYRKYFILIIIVIFKKKID